MKTLTYICMVDVPLLGMVKDKKYEVDADSDTAKMFASMTDCFKEVVPDDEKWHTGDIVSLNGRFVNLTHTSKNRYGSGEMLKDVVARINEIHLNTGGSQAYITFRTDGGIVYVSENCPIRRSECTGTNTRSSQKIKLVDNYWFINSRGIICNAIAGKDYDADRWRKISGNYFSTKNDCEKHYQKILTSAWQDVCNK